MVDVYWHFVLCRLFGYVDDDEEEDDNVSSGDVVQGSPKQQCA